MDFIDGSGFWLAGTTAAPAEDITAGGTFKPTWRPRRRCWWWITVLWQWCEWI